MNYVLWGMEDIVGGTKQMTYLFCGGGGGGGAKQKYSISLHMKVYSSSSKFRIFQHLCSLRSLQVSMFASLVNYARCISGISKDLNISKSHMGVYLLTSLDRL